MPQLSVNYRDFCGEVTKLDDLLNGISSLEPTKQRLIYELIHLRLFSLLELHLKSITIKLLCSAPYCDGTLPNLLHNSPNATQAMLNMRSMGRPTTIAEKFIRWNDVPSIESNVQYLLDTNDNLLTELRKYVTVIDHMRRLRNHIAHQNPDTRRKFKPVVAHHYGAYANSVTPGILLISPRQTPCLLRQYLATTRVLIKDTTKS